MFWLSPRFLDVFWKPENNIIVIVIVHVYTLLYYITSIDIYSIYIYIYIYICKTTVRQLHLDQPFLALVALLLPSPSLQLLREEIRRFRQHKFPHMLRFLLLLCSLKGLENMVSLCKSHRGPVSELYLYIYIYHLKSYYVILCHIMTYYIILNYNYI